MRKHLWLILLEAFLGLTLMLYLSKYWFLPAYPSVDFVQNVRLSLDVAKGNLPNLQGAVGYYGVYFYEAVWLKLLPGNPFLATRVAISVLVFLSPLAFYAAMKGMADDDEGYAQVGTLLYVLSGFVWFQMVFNAGLFANFYGVFSSLILLAALSRFLKGRLGVANSLFLLLSVANALFSHYSTFLMWPAMLVMVALLPQSINRKRIKIAAASALLMAPIAVGLVASPNVASTLLGFISPNQTGATGYTSLAQSLSSWPVVAFIVTEMQWDVGAAVMLLLAVMGISLIVKRRATHLAPPLIWFASTVAAAPFNVSAWRFSLVALVPMIMLSTLPLSLAWQPVKARKLRPRRTNRSALAALLMAIIVVGGWSLRPWAPLGALPDATSNAALVSEYQVQQAKAFAWMRQQNAFDACGQTSYGPDLIYQNATISRWSRTTPEACSFLSLTDWHFQYSQDLAGVMTDFNPTLTSPETASFYAAQYGGMRYLIVSNVTTIPLIPCNTGSLLVLTVKNMTANHAVLNAHYFSSTEPAVFLSVYVNGTMRGLQNMTKNNAIINMDFAKKGTFDVSTRLGGVESNTQRLFVGTDKPPQDIEQSIYSCMPWNWNSNDLFGANLVWSSSLIKIWDLRA